MSTQKSRHTAASGRLTRSFGIEDDQDLVAEINEDGTLRIREEPVHRKLKRGEAIPEVVLVARDIWDARKTEAPVGDTESRIDKVLARLPIADLSGSPEQVGYRAKVWLMAELKREFEK
jgi:hypothetical protein